MKKEEAIKRFGVHYYAVFERISNESIYSHQLLNNVSNIRVVESLGRMNGRNSYVTEEDATEHALDRVKNSIEKNLDWFEQWQGSLSAKFKISAARIGLKKDSKRYLELVDRVFKASEILKNLKEKGVDVKIERLPEEIKTPILLKEGQKIYRVQALYISDFENPKEPPLTEHRITDIRLIDGRGDYDYCFDYELDNGESFKYPHDKISDEAIEGPVINYHYFLSREAAEEHLRKIAKRISDTVAPYVKGPEPGP